MIKNYPLHIKQYHFVRLSINSKRNPYKFIGELFSDIFNFLHKAQDLSNQYRLKISNISIFSKSYSLNRGHFFFVFFLYISVNVIF
jgi:hypothetical protein